MIQRKLDELGRVLIPEEMTRKLGISSKTLLNIHLDGERIIIEKTGDSCLFCGNSENVIDGFHGLPQLRTKGCGRVKARLITVRTITLHKPSARRFCRTRQEKPRRGFYTPVL